MMTVLAGMSAAILALAPITNPIGGLAAFAGLTAGDSPAAVRSQAWKTGVYVFAILTVFADYRSRTWCLSSGFRLGLRAKVAVI